MNDILSIYNNNISDGHACLIHTVEKIQKSILRS